MWKGQKNMKNIYEILADYGLEIPQDKKEAFDNSVKENYKTVTEVAKITSATFGADVPSEFEENIKMCCCALAQVIFADSQNSGGKTSEKVGTYV